MERYIYTTLTGAMHTLTAQRIHANNLANASTTGFRRDFERAESYVVQGAGHSTRVLSQTQATGTDFTPGRLEETGRDLDIGIQGAGFIAVLDAKGQEAYTRAGNFQIDDQGRLLSQGREVNGANGPLVLPEFAAISIGRDGTISITPPGGGLMQVGQIKLVNPDPEELVKGADGLFRLTNGEEADQAPEVVVLSGHLERSNVNAVDEMVTTLALTRTFEIQVKMMKAADENSASGSRLVRGG